MRIHINRRAGSRRGLKKTFGERKTLSGPRASQKQRMVSEPSAAKQKNSESQFQAIGAGYYSHDFITRQLHVRPNNCMS